MSDRQEWDYPPSRVRLERGYKVIDSEPDPWTSPTATKVAGFYWRTIKMVFKILMGGFIGVFLTMLIWLFLKAFGHI